MSLCEHCIANKIKIFEDLSIEINQKLQDVSQCFHIKKGNIIFEESLNPKGLFYILDGKVKLTQMSTEGKEQIVHLAKNKNIMGYRAILGNDFYSCSATAITDSILWMIPAQNFIDLVFTQPNLSKYIILLLSKELREAENKITNLAHFSVKQRVAQSILYLKDFYGYEPDNKTINLIFTREELANLSGTMRETATRALREIKEDNIISLVGKKIVINKLSELEKMSHLFF